MLRLALAQLDLTVGALAENRNASPTRAPMPRAAGAEIVLAPELAISGYPPEDLLLRPALPAACQAEAELLAAEVEVAARRGLPVARRRPRAQRRRCCSRGGAIVARYDKRELPNYGVFDEERTFSPGRGSLHVITPGGALALTICEDVWLPTPSPRRPRRRRELRAEHLGLAVPPRKGPGARGDARDARARRALRRRVLQYRRRPGRAHLRRPQRVFGPDGAVLARAA